MYYVFKKREKRVNSHQMKHQFLLQAPSKFSNMPKLGKQIEIMKKLI